jgi:addiction module RelE/StbE family toxin
MKIQNIILEKNFKKQFIKLDIKIQSQFKNRIEMFLENQFHSTLNNHSLHGEWDGCYSINITGDIRATYEIIGSTAFFIAIGSHNQLYK